MNNNRLKNLVLSAMFLCLALTLPFFTGQLKQIGSMLLPMHAPVFLCGLICSWKYGLAVGFTSPILRSLIFNMPHMFPDAVSMAFELATYGFVVGYIYSHSKWHCTKTLLKSMIIAMLAGRFVWGVIRAILMGFGKSSFSLSMFVSGAFLNAIPGIIIQLVLIPFIMVALNKAKLVPITKKYHHKEKANEQEYNN